ncbi:MAG: calcium-binding protein, partial [Cyanobacteria bacterium P01_A01_bin.135]
FIAQAEEVIDFSKDLNDEGRLIAEFWEDGGGTSFPPGTWMTFGQFVSARDNNSLDEDVELFFTLGNAVFDAGVATWEAKVFYDYVRPIRAIRNLGELGLIGEFDPDLGGFAIEAYAGPGQGTQKILATDFITYQTPNADVSPPFAEYTSGHSAFSASAATVLELLSGSDRFGSSVTFQPGESRFDVGVTPAEELTLAWDTFSFAADEAGLSRLYGGIHFTDGDVNGRSLGQQIGVSAFETAQFFINGGEESPFLIGSRDGDSLTGSSDDEEFHGRSGSDVLTARAGDDALYGGDGDDSLTGNAGSDKLYGESGDDTLLGKLGDDQLFGGADVDLLRGAKGGDRLVGGVGDDTLKGNAGDDVLIGNNGDDTLVGGNGDDRLGGGLGDDTLTTGIGNDRVVIFSGDGVDTVTDFSDGSDLIVLADIDFSDITLSQQGSGTLISFGDESLLVLENVSIEQISETDFV